MYKVYAGVIWVRGLMLRVICARRLPLEARVYVWFIRYAR